MPSPGASTRVPRRFSRSRNERWRKTLCRNERWPLSSADVADRPAEARRENEKHGQQGGNLRAMHVDHDERGDSDRDANHLLASEPLVRQNRGE